MVLRKETSLNRKPIVYNKNGSHNSNFKTPTLLFYLNFYYKRYVYVRPCTKYPTHGIKACVVKQGDTLIIVTVSFLKIFVQSQNEVALMTHYILNYITKILWIVIGKSIEQQRQVGILGEIGLNQLKPAYSLDLSKVNGCVRRIRIDGV
ncbi:hypothetical protein BpHYR1_034180 [Brachionus plicatilis]|uniref:Uncharacterized protein n=1 Tax=Brachionus plicatilis TaxID=10195 RepID=A0A3M7QJV2_BRAPC|nr:hypothetical protein BpHYR1_034180 [Brachionus plicatilis]